jgi:hypothetical protein
MTSGPTQSLFGWRSGIICAILLSIAVTSSGTLILADDPVMAFGAFLFAVRKNLLLGAIVVAITWFGAPRLSPLSLLAAICLGVLLATLARFALPAPVQTLIFGPTHLRSVPAYDGMLVSPIYMAWLYLLYGGLFAGAFALIHRVERTRASLARAELARSQIDTLLTQAELSGLRGAVDPAFLLRVLDEARRRDADAANPAALLERLVDFLRLAMPGIRSSGRSTLAAELAVIAGRLRLADELDARAPRWQSDVDPFLWESPFPPLLLLPIVEHLLAAKASGGVIAVKTNRDEHGVTLTLRGVDRSCEPPDELLRRLRIGLQAMHGQAVDVIWQVDAGCNGHSMTMTLPLLPSVDLAALRVGDEPALQQPS